MSDRIDASFAEGSIRDYLGRLASAAPAPGGGSVAALTGAAAAGLVTMVADITLGNEKHSAVGDDMQEMRAAAEHARSRLTELISLDAEAYGAVAAAMRMPKDTEDEKASRQQALQGALRFATDVPLEMAGLALDVARLALVAAEKGSPMVVADAGVAAVLAQGAVESAILNVKTNLAWVTDQAFVQAAWGRAETIVKQTSVLRDSVIAITCDQLPGSSPTEREQVWRLRS